MGGSCRFLLDGGLESMTRHLPQMFVLDMHYVIFFVMSRDELAVHRKPVLFKVSHSE